MNNRVSTTTAEQIINMLSDRERDVARLLAWGKVKKDIADILHVAPSTVSVHFRNIYSKIGIHKETDLCRCWIFFENGIADNPLKKVIAVLLLMVSLSAVLTESNTLRVFRSMPMRTVARVVKPLRARRYANIFELKLSMT